ncbi:MAG TPA: UbiA family prenyltransferase [Micromonosporaceae bacterium]|nr:UbiA family prenyltransferase [Micromonosporaceae bacterium]
MSELTQEAVGAGTAVRPGLATGAGPVARLLGVLGSARPTTRLWFDLLAPAAMMAAVYDGPAPVRNVVAMLSIAVLFHAAANFFNDSNDVEVDAASSEPSRQLRPVQVGRISPRDLNIAGAVLVAASVLLALLLPWPAVLLLLVVLVLNVAYNFPPVRLAGRPVVLQVFWPVIWALMFALCALAMRSGTWRDALPFLAFVALFMGVGEGITQDVRDVDNDAAGGRRTTPVVFGLKASLVVAWLAQLLSVGAWLWYAQTGELALGWTVAGTLVLAGWLAYFLRLAWRLWPGRGGEGAGLDKPAAKLTHVGSIYVFSAVNLIVVLAAVLPLLVG